MAATERIGSLQQSSSALQSSTLLSIRPLHPSFEFGRPHKKHTLSLQASITGKDDHGVTLRKSYEEGSGRKSVSSLLKAVQEGGSNAVMQQVSSIRHFFMPELPYAIISEIKKRMPLSFKEQDDEEDEVQDDFNGGLLNEKELQDQVMMMGPRCAWPRLRKLTTTTSTKLEERQEGVVQGPRCTWPRSTQTVSSSTILSSVQQWKEEERLSATGGGGSGARGAKCAWPRALKSKNHDQEQTQAVSLATSRSPMKELENVGLISTQEGLGTSLSSLEGLQKEAISREHEAVSKSSQEGEKEKAMVNSDVIERPRCAWPRSTPRRMLATGVGLSLINYVFVGQGAPALAILFQSPLPIICEEDSSLCPLP